MQDMKVSAEKLSAEADYAEQIARSATDLRKRELYERLAAHFRQLADEIEKVMAKRAEVLVPHYGRTRFLDHPSTPEARAFCVGSS